MQGLGFNAQILSSRILEKSNYSKCIITQTVHFGKACEERKNLSAKATKESDLRKKSSKTQNPAKLNANIKDTLKW
jgi:hypothetical protein